MALEKIRPGVVDETQNYVFNNVTATGNLVTLNANLGNLVVANYVTGTLTTNAQPNVTSLGTLSNLTVTGNISAGNIKTDRLLYANGNPWAIGSTTTVAGSNTQLQFNDSGSFAGSADLTFDKTTNTLSVTSIIANGSSLSSLTGANVTGQVGNAVIAGTVYTNAQPNITSLGTLTTLVVTDNITSGNASLGNLVSASYFSGNGSLLSSITGGNVSGQVNYAATANSVAGANVVGQVTYAATANSVAGANVSGQVANALIAGTVYTNAQPNITSVGTLTSLSVTGTVNSGNANLGNLVTGNYFTGNGSLLVSLTGANVSGAVAFATTANSVAGANVSGAVAFATTANSVAGANVSGQVANALVSGTVYTNAQPNITSVGTLTSLAVINDVIVGGNLTVNGVTTTVNSTTVIVNDVNLVLANNAANAAVANGAGITINGANASILYNSASNAFTLSHLISANGSLLTSITGANVSGQVANALVAGTVYTNAQPNITSVGTLTSLAVTGNISVGNANLGNLVTANFYSGSGNLLSNIQGGNVTGQVSYAAVANSVAGANVVGQVTYAATAFAIAGGNVLGQVANALVAGTVTTNAQPNITSVGSLTSLTVTGNLSVGNVNGGNLSSANYFSGNGSQLSALTFGNIAAFSTANLTVDELYLSSTTRLNVTASGMSGYIFDQYGPSTVNPAIYVTSGQTLAFNLNVTGHPFLIQTSAGANYNTGLEHIDTTGTVSVTSAAQGKIAGTLYWKVPYGLTGNYKYQCSIHGGMNGNIVVTDANIANVSVGTVYSNAQPNITSLGTLTSLVVTGNISAGNANLGNNVTSNFFTGSGQYLTSVTAVTAGTVTTNAQPNITSVGTLTTLIVGNATANSTFGNGTITTNGNINFTGANVSLGEIGNIKITGGTLGYFITTDGAGNLSWGAASGGGGGGVSATGSNTQIQFNDNGALGATANLTFNKVTNTLSTGRVVASAGANLGNNVSNVYIGGGGASQILATDGSGNLTWIAQSTATITVDNFTGDGTTTTFTLSTTPSNINQTIINYNGAFQLRTSAYTLSGPTVTFTEAPASGSLIEVTTTMGTTSGAGAFVTRTYTGNGVQTNYTVTSGMTASSVLVSENGLIQTPTTDYTISGTTLTFAVAPTNGTVIQIRELAVAIATTVSPAYRAYTGNGVQNTFTVTTGLNANSLIIAENGILQRPTTDYTVSGSTVTFVSAPANGVDIQIRELSLNGGMSTGGTSLPFQGGNSGKYLTTDGATASWSNVGGSVIVKDEGSNLTTAVASIDFVGAGVTATNTGNSVTVTIPSSGTTVAKAFGYSLVFGG